MSHSQAESAKAVSSCSTSSEEAAYTQVGSIEYVKNLEILKKKSNAPSICTQCWCFMATKQSKSHRADHIKNRMTAS